MNDQQPSSADEASGPLSNIKILSVEDDMFIESLLARKLQAAGCELFHSKHGDDAVDMVRKEKPDIVLLDLMLSGADGYDILKTLKDDPETKTIPVVILSNLSSSADVEKGMELGASLFITKAKFSLDEVVTQIQDVLKNLK